MRIHFVSDERPTRVAKSLRKHLAALGHMFPFTTVREATAVMYGYRNWNDLRAQVGSAPASPADQDSDASVVAERRLAFVDALVSKLAIPRDRAEAAIDAVGPMSRRRIGTPDIDTLDINAIPLEAGRMRVGDVDVFYLEGPRNRSPRETGPKSLFRILVGVDDDGIRLASPMRATFPPVEGDNSSYETIAEAVERLLRERPEADRISEAVTQIGLVDHRIPAAWTYRGDLPPGVEFDADTGTFHGTPTHIGEWRVVTRNGTPKHPYPGSYEFVLEVIEGDVGMPEPFEMQPRAKFSLGKPFRYLRAEKVPGIRYSQIHYISGMVDSEIHVASRKDDRTLSVNEIRSRISARVRSAMGLESLEERLGAERIRLFRKSQKLGLEDSLCGEALRCPPSKAALALAFVERRPDLTHLALSDLAASFEGDDDSVAVDLAARQGLHPAILKRTSPDFPLAEPMRKLASAVPVDWIPGREDVDGWRAFESVASVVAKFEHAKEAAAIRTLVDGSRGRWGDFLHALEKAGGRKRGEIPNVAGILRDVSDLNDTVRDFQDYLVLPLVQAHGVSTMRVWVRDEGMVERLLLGRRGLPRLIEMSKLHHRLGSPKLVEEEFEWQPFLPRLEREGFEIVPLVSSLELTEEGKDLAHCVGGAGYAYRCADHVIRILSLRKDGKRVSTAHMTIAAEPFVVDHRGYRNVEAPSDAATALRSYLMDPEVKAACLAIKEARDAKVWDATSYSARYDRTVEPDKAMELFAAWRPFLLGDVADLDFEALSAMMAESVTVEPFSTRPD